MTAPASMKSLASAVLALAYENVSTHDAADTVRVSPSPNPAHPPTAETGGRFAEKVVAADKLSNADTSGIEASSLGPLQESFLTAEDHLSPNSSDEEKDISSAVSLDDQGEQLVKDDQSHQLDNDIEWSSYPQEDVGTTIECELKSTSFDQDTSEDANGNCPHKVEPDGDYDGDVAGHEEEQEENGVNVETSSSEQDEIDDHDDSEEDADTSHSEESEETEEEDEEEEVVGEKRFAAPIFDQGVSSQSSGASGKMSSPDMAARYNIHAVPQQQEQLEDPLSDLLEKTWEKVHKSSNKVQQNCGGLVGQVSDSVQKGLDIAKTKTEMHSMKVSRSMEYVEKRATDIATSTRGKVAALYKKRFPFRFGA